MGTFVGDDGALRERDIDLDDVDEASTSDMIMLEPVEDVESIREDESIRLKSEELLVLDNERNLSHCSCDFPKNT